MNRRRVLTVVAVGMALLLAVTFARRPGRGGPPLDPASTDADGTRALVELLERLGSRVEVVATPPAAGVDVLVVLRDRFDGGDRAAVETWVRAGGRLVNADVTSPLAIAVPAEAADRTLSRGCELAALRGADEIQAPVVLLRPPPGATACYAAAGGAWLVAAASGSGTVVQLGGPAPFLNERLGDADNAVAAAALAAPHPGLRVAVLDPNLPGASGSDARSLRDLLATGVKAGLIQLVVAFVVVALWRARRVGAPVDEPAVVSMPPAAIVPSVAALHQRARARAGAARRLRAGARRRLSRRLGVPVDAPDAAVAAAAAARLGVDHATVEVTLGGPEPVTDEALLELARAVDDLMSALEQPAGRIDARQS